MRKSVVALSLLLVLSASVLAACGSDDSSSTSSTKTATVPDGNLNATAVPVERGFYAGVSCGQPSCDFYGNKTKALAFAHKACSKGKPAVDQPQKFTYYDSKETKYVVYPICFTREDRAIKDFYFNKVKVFGSGHSDPDRFKDLSDNGNVISGEWFNAEDVAGTYRSPNLQTTHWVAEYSPS